MYLKFNFNVLWILFPFVCLRDLGQRFWVDKRSREIKNEKWQIRDAMIHLTWEITEKRLWGVDVGVWKWYANVASMPAQILTVLLFCSLECWSPGIFTWDLLCENSYYSLHSPSLSIWWGNQGWNIFPLWLLVSPFMWQSWIHNFEGFFHISHMFLVQRVLISFTLSIFKELTPGIECF